MEAGDIEAGATIHFVTSKRDDGPAIIQASVPIKDSDCADTLAKRILGIDHVLFPIAAKWLVQGCVVMKSKNALFDGVALPPKGKIVTTGTRE